MIFFDIEMNLTAVFKRECSIHKFLFKNYAFDKTKLQRM